MSNKWEERSSNQVEVENMSQELAEMKSCKNYSDKSYFISTSLIVCN